jgi:hypothetical protein
MDSGSHVIGNGKTSASTVADEADATGPTPTTGSTQGATGDVSAPEVGFTSSSAIGTVASTEGDAGSAAAQAGLAALAGGVLPQTGASGVLLLGACWDSCSSASV